MNSETPTNTLHQNPVFSMAGVMPGGSEMTGWKTAYPNPDAQIARPRPVGHGPSFSMAGVMPGSSGTPWRTAMPNPDNDVLDGHGHVVTKIEAAARAEAELARHPRSLRPATSRGALAAPAA